MSAGFDVAREVAAAVDSRVRVWHFIRCFAELLALISRGRAALDAYTQALRDLLGGL
jgi:hypothetical protein